MPMSAGDINTALNMVEMGRNAEAARLLRAIVEGNAGVLLGTDATVVRTTGAQSIAGVKTFTSTPVMNTIQGQSASIKPKMVMPAATSDATAGNRTYTAAEILGGIIVRDCAGASRSDVLPTAALLVAAITAPAVGDVVTCLIVNGSDAAEVITIGAGAGGGFDANQTAASRVIPQNASKMVHIRLTNVTAASEAYVVYA